MFNICENDNRLTLQLHITGKCNQQCKHCYHESYTNELLSFENIEKIIKDYIELLEKYNKLKKIKCRGHINVTGGEPFIRKDFFDILELFHQNRNYFTYGILTNGSFITKETAKRLKDLKVSHIQVSLDGSPKTHDYIRGEGNFKQTLNALKILNKYKIKTMVSFTAHKLNYKEFEIVAKYCRLYKVDKLWSDRLVPFGNGEDMKEYLLNKEEALEYFEILNKEKEKYLLNKISGMEVSTNRALQFLKSGDIPYSCSAGDSLITITELGDIVPCRRMPIVCGNILKDNLSEIYLNNKTFQDLRNENIPNKCNHCLYKNKCRGGLKCVAYALYETYNEVDPSCPLA